MSVVATLKFDQFAAPGGAARQADGAHGCLGPGADQAHHVHAGHVFQDFFGQLHFALRRCAKGKAFSQRFLHGIHHGRVPVAQNHRAPRANVIGIALAIGIPHIGALCATDKARCATHRPEGAHG